MSPLACTRRPAALLLALALSGLVTGCGDSDEPEASATRSAPTAAASFAPSVAPSPSPVPEVPLTSARAMAVAQDVALRAADVPSLRKAEDGDEDASPATVDEEDPFDACLSKGAATKLATYSSPTYRTGSAELQGYEVGSETEVVALAADARRDFALLTSPALISCLNKAIAQDFANDPETAGASLSGSFSRVPTSKPTGADGAARFVYEGTVAGPGLSQDFSIGITALLVGRAEVSLVESAYGSDRLSGPDRDTLVGVLLRRAQSAQHLNGL